MPEPKSYLCKDGTTRYRVRFRHRGRQTSETFRTLAQAKAFCGEIDRHGVEYAVSQRQAYDDQDWLERSTPLDKVAEAYFAWKETRVRSDRTVHDYRRYYELSIKPRLGHMPIATITERDVQQWIDDMGTGVLSSHTRHGSTGRPYEPKTIHDRHALLHAIIKWAIVPGRSELRTDPCADTDLPKVPKKLPKGLRPAEWQALYAALQQIDPDAADLAAFMLASGWRWSEATALTAYSVEDYGDKMIVSVAHVIRRNAAGQHVSVEDTKSAAGARRVALDDNAAALVRRRLESVHGDGLVFTTKNGAQWSHAHFRDRYWYPAVETANLSRRPTPHWLRHTHVAWMVMQGASLPELQSRIGHASIQTTIGVYGRMIQDVQPAALSGFAAMMDGKSKQPQISQPTAADG